MDHTLKQRQSPAILLEGLQVTLPSRAGPIAILRGIDLSVQVGDAIAVVGPSGSGKSTLLMVIAGLEQATAGRVSVLGTDFAGLDEDSLARLRAANIGIVFQSFHLVPTMTAIENVALPLEFLDHHDAFNASRTSLAEVGLSHRETHFPGQLSGGEQQRVAIARALVNDPLVLIADEPTGNLDPDLAQEIMSLFERINGQGTTVLVATHDRGLIQRMKKRVIGLDHGRLAFDSPAPASQVVLTPL
jgi:putative ABC transport system ATP-binding protein